MSQRADVSVALLDWFGEAERVIQDVEWKLEDRDDSTNRLYVTTSLAEVDGVKTEQELIYRQRRFSVVEIDRDRAADKAVIEADEVQAELADLVLVEFKPNSWTLEQAVTAALAGTRWTIGELVGTRYGRAEFEDISVLDALKFLARHQDARLSFDSLRRRVNITPNAGTDHEIVFTYGRQLANIEKSESAPTTTVIYPTGAEGMTVASVNDGVPYVEDYGYYTAQGISLAEARDRFRKEDYWSDERYTVKGNLLRDAQARLAVEAYPQISYTLTAQATRAVDGQDDFDLTVLRLGDRVHVWDQEIDAKIRAEVTAVTTSSDASENELVLSYLPPSLGAGVEGTYFGDSGRPSDGPNGRPLARSVPQPRPSMPILEAINDLGTAVIRWNGQDHEGSFETIPEQFGEVQSFAAPLVDGVIPSPTGPTVFQDGATGRRAGGTMPVSFGRPGTYAVWFQMVGRDGQTRSEFSEPLTVEVPEFVDTSAIEAELEDARGLITEADERLTTGQSELDGKLAELDQRKAEREELNIGLADVYADAEQRAEQLATNALNQATADAQTKFDQAMEVAERALSRAGDNLVEDPGFETNHWVDEWNGLGGRLVRTSTAPVRTGERILVVEDGTPVDLSFPDVDVELDQSYRMTIWYRTWDSNLADLSDEESALVFYDSDTGAELARSEPLTVGSTYRRAEVIYQVPDNVQSIRPAIRASWPAGQMLFDDVSVREVGAAAEALRQAELARIEAEAAHLEAGSARDLAASAYDAASGKNSIHWSLTAPTGTGSDGDVWWRYTNLTGSSRRQVMQSWHWDNGVWREDQLSESYLPQVNIGTGTYGDLDGERLRAASVMTRHLAVGNWDNRIKDPDFEQIGLGTNIHWRPASPSAWGRLSLPSALNGFTLGLVSEYRTGSTHSLFYGRVGEGIPVTPGESFQVQFKKWIASPSGETDFRLRMEFIHSDGSTTLSGNRSMVGAAAYTRYREDFTIPDNVVAIRPVWYLGATVSIGIYDVSITRMSDGNLIVQNGVKSQHVDTDEFFANLAVIDKIYNDITLSRLVQAVGIITENMVATESITAPKLRVTEDMVVKLFSAMEARIGDLAFNTAAGMDLDAGRITTGSLTGRTVQTSSNWASAGGAVMRQDGSAGNFVAVNDAGQTVARLGGARNELSNLDVVGELRFGTASLIGYGRLASDGDRMRIQGVMPLDTGAARDTLLYGYTPPATIDLAGGASPRVIVVYPEPRPDFQSAPFLQTGPYGLGGPQDRQPNVVACSTYYATRSGFEVISRCVGAGPNSTDQYSIRYNSLWRASADDAG